MRALQEKILAAARTCVGTPFKHQGRVPGLGLDCVGLACHVMDELNLPYKDQQGYPRTPYKGQLQAAIAGQRYVTEVDGEMQAGDILLMRFGRDPQHVAILTENGTIVHSWQDAGKCCEHDLTPEWKRRIVKIYRIVEQPE